MKTTTDASSGTGSTVVVTNRLRAFGSISQIEVCTACPGRECPLCGGTGSYKVPVGGGNHGVLRKE